MEFSSQEYLSGLPFLTPGDFLDPEIKPASPPLAGMFFTTEPPGKPWKIDIDMLPSHKKHNEILPFAAMWKDLEKILYLV